MTGVWRVLERGILKRFSSCIRPFGVLAFLSSRNTACYSAALQTKRSRAVSLFDEHKDKWSRWWGQIVVKDLSGCNTATDAVSTLLDVELEYINPTSPLSSLHFSHKLKSKTLRDRCHDCCVEDLALKICSNSTVWSVIFFFFPEATGCPCAWRTMCPQVEVLDTGWWGCLAMFDKFAYQWSW